MLNWAMSPHVKRLNMAFVLIDEKLSDLSDRLTGNPHVATIEVPLPRRDGARRVPRRASNGRQRRSRPSRDFDAAELAKLTAGISLTDLNVLVQSARESGKRLDRERLPRAEEAADRAPVPGLLEFIEPKWTLDTVVGHEAAKQRLRDDAALLKRGALDSLPMGYLLCGPVGTGKSFLAQCVSGEIGMPVRDPEELPLEVRRRDRGQPRARAVGAARDGTGGRRGRRSGRGARRAASRRATPARRAACSR